MAGVWAGQQLYGMLRQLTPSPVANAEYHNHYNK